MKRPLSAVLSVAILCLSFVVPVWAGVATVEGVTLTTPDTYGSCSATTDVITIAGLSAKNQGGGNLVYEVAGWVEAQYVLPGGGRQSFQSQSFSGRTADFQVLVTYPPVQDWPLTDAVFNTAEIHIDLAFELIVRNTVTGVTEFIGTLGPGTDWDVFCQNPPAPPPPGNPGTGTPGYWKTHPEAWPVDTLTLGGVDYSKADALYWMGQPDGDKSITLFRALVSAKLNVLIGNTDSCVADTIAAADNWFSAHGPVGGKIKANSAAWKQGEPLYLTLDAYNNGALCAPHRD